MKWKEVRERPRPFRPFRAWRDPLFWTGIGLWAVNKFCLRPNFDWIFLHAYFNDFLCAAVTVPTVVTLTGLLRLRDPDGPPNALEVAVPLCVIAGVFELWLPFQPGLESYNISDPGDILAYVLGGVCSYVFWTLISSPDTGLDQTTGNSRNPANPPPP